MWTIADAGTPYNYIENRWQTADWINIEGLQGFAQYAGTQPGWYSAMWQFVNPVVARAVATTTLQSSMLANGIISIDRAAAGTIYPNPATGQSFYVVLPTLQPKQKATVTISGVGGNIMQSIQLTASGEVKHHLSRGVYFVRIDAGQFSVTKKLVIE